MTFCKDCRFFWLQANHPLGEGECRIRAPSIQHVVVDMVDEAGKQLGQRNLPITSFPDVTPDTWCGEGKPKELE
jgi:hypothetical protein